MKLGTAISASEAKRGVTLGANTHGINNLKGSVDALEHLRHGDIERIVKVETNLANLEKGQERIEHFDKMERDSAAGRAEIIDTIREVSKREIKI